MVTLLTYLMYSLSNLNVLTNFVWYRYCEKLQNLQPFLWPSSFNMCIVRYIYINSMNFIHVHFMLLHNHISCNNANVAASSFSLLITKTTTAEGRDNGTFYYLSFNSLIFNPVTINN